MDENISRAAGASHGQLHGRRRTSDAIVEPLGPAARAAHHPLRSRRRVRRPGPTSSPPPAERWPDPAVRAARPVPRRRARRGSRASPRRASRSGRAGSSTLLAAERADLYRSILGTVWRAWPTSAPTSSTSRWPTPRWPRWPRPSASSGPSATVHKVTFFGSARTLPDDPLYLQARRPGRAHGRPRLDGRHRRRARASWPPACEGAGPEHVHRRQHPAPPRAGGQRLHRPGPEARRDALLLHPQAHAHQGVRRLRRPPRRVRHPRRGLRAPHPAPDGQGRAGPARAARRPRRDLLARGGEFLDARGRRPGPGLPRGPCALLRITADVDDAAGELLGFYRNYHSCRWVGDLLVIRLRRRTRPAPSWPSSTGASPTSWPSGPIRPTKPLGAGALRQRPRRAPPAGPALRPDPLRPAPPADRRPQRLVD